MVEIDDQHLQIDLMAVAILIIITTTTTIIAMMTTRLRLAVRSMSTRQSSSTRQHIRNIKSYLYQICLDKRILVPDLIRPKSLCHFWKTKKNSAHVQNFLKRGSKCSYQMIYKLSTKKISYNICLRN